MLSTRAELIQTILPAPNDASRPWSSLRESTVEPLYAIPADLLDLLEDRANCWFTSAELELERRLTKLCSSFHAVAIFLGSFVSHPFFFRPEMPDVTDDIPAQLSKELTTSTSMKLTLKRTDDSILAVLNRREAYVGWLTTSAEFLEERNALRTKWQDTVELLGSIPSFRIRTVMECHEILSAVPLPDLNCLANDFEAFCERWDLLGFATWDLPQPKQGNLGAPELFGELCGVENSPAVQLAPTLRLPARFPVDDLLQSKVGDHLAEWNAVIEQRHPDKINYLRLQRAFHLHFLRNVILANGYRERFRRRVGLLDKVFAQYLGERDEESMRKLRLWIDRRLRVPAGRWRK